MAYKRHLWFTDLVMATMKMLVNFVIGFLMAKIAYLLNFRSLGPSQGP